MDTYPQKTRPVLLLGGNGRLGRILRRYWPVHDDLIAQSRSGGADLQFDPQDVDAVQAAAINCRAILNFTGVVSGRGSFDANVSLAKIVVDSAGGKPVFLASSAAVYGHRKICAESDAPTPVSDYGRSKLEMEERCQAPSVCALRIGNVAGADAILGGWREGFSLDVLPDGTTPKRSYVGPKSFAKIICALTQCEGLPPVLNVAQPGLVAMGDLLDAAKLCWKPRPAPENVVKCVELNTTELSRHVQLGKATAKSLAAEWAENSA